MKEVRVAMWNYTPEDWIVEKEDNKHIWIKFNNSDMWTKKFLKDNVTIKWKN